MNINTKQKIAFIILFATIIILYVSPLILNLDIYYWIVIGGITSLFGGLLMGYILALEIIKEKGIDEVSVSL